MKKEIRRWFELYRRVRTTLPDYYYKESFASIRLSSERKWPALAYYRRRSLPVAEVKQATTAAVIY